MSSLQANTQNFKWVSSQSVQDKSSDYAILNVDLKKIVESWRSSIIAHEWLAGGEFKKVETLSFHLRTQWGEALKNIQSSENIERPILGIGVLDNVEIGTNRAILSVADHLGYNSIEVVVPKKMVDLFKDFVA